MASIPCRADIDFLWLFHERSIIAVLLDKRNLTNDKKRRKNTVDDFLINDTELFVNIDRSTTAASIIIRCDNRHRRPIFERDFNVILAVFNYVYLFL